MNVELYWTEKYATPGIPQSLIKVHLGYTLGTFGVYLEST